MPTMHSWTIQLLVCMVLVGTWGLAPAQLGYNPCDDGQKLHYDADSGHEICCVPEECPMGSIAILCHPNTPNSTRCMVCPEGTYMNHRTQSYQLNSHCYPKTECETGKRVIGGSTVKDDVCGECMLEEGYYPEYISENQVHCHRKQCPAGEELHIDDSVKNNIVATCVPCRPSHFKAKDGFFQCNPWKHCVRYQMEEVPGTGSATTDVMCRVKNDTVATTFGYDDSIEEIKSKSGVSPLKIALPVALGLLVAACIILGSLCCFWQQKRRRLDESMATACEKKVLQRENSEDSSPEIQNYKNMNRVPGRGPVVPPRLDINKAKQYSQSEISFLTAGTGQHTPDSGIAEMHAFMTTPLSRGSSGKSGKHPFILPRSVEVDMNESTEEINAVNPSSPGPNTGTRSTINSNSSPSESYGSADTISQQSFPQDLFPGGSTEQPAVHMTPNRGVTYNKYVIQNLIYQPGNQNQINNYSYNEEQADNEDEGIPPLSEQTSCSSETNSEDYLCMAGTAV